MDTKKKPNILTLGVLEAYKINKNKVVLVESSFWRKKEV
jgi:hypothetical protein